MNKSLLSGQPRSIWDSPAFLKLLAGVILILLWEIGARTVGSAHIASPLRVIAVAPSVLVSEGFLQATGATLLAVLQGLLIAVVLGTLIGLCMGRMRTADWILKHYITAFFAMPIIAAVPLVILWFGNTPNARLATIVFAAIFSVILSARDGAKSVSQDFLDVARVYGAKPWRVWLEITPPVALPYLVSGVRLATGRALIGALVAEFLLSIDGLGFFILVKSRTYEHDAAFVAVLLLAVVGLAVDWALNWFVLRITPWYRRGN